MSNRTDVEQLNRPANSEALERPLFDAGEKHGFVAILESGKRRIRPAVSAASAAVAATIGAAAASIRLADES